MIKRFTWSAAIPLIAATTLLTLAQTPTPPKLSVLGTYRTGVYNQGGAEIVAHDPATQRLFVVNGGQQSVDILDMTSPAAMKLIKQVKFLPEHGRAANSVAVRNGVVAVAVEAMVKTDPGTCVFLDTDGNLINAVKVGALPDMLTFTPDGHKLLVANEAEPSDDYSVDPEGSVSIIDVSKGVRDLTDADVRTAGFGGFAKESLEPGVRIFGPRASVAQDLEPEYITVSPDSKTAYVTLQENNAIGVLDIEAGKFTRIAALGVKEHWRQGNELDVSDRDNRAGIYTWPIYGMYQPDAIASFVGPDNKLYLITANEGDAREWGTYVEAARVSTLKLDPSIPGGAALQAADGLGRLNVSTASGDLDGDGDFDVLYSFGGRSITVWSPNIEALWDSHNQFEVFLLQNRPEAFNLSHTDNSVDSRSDDKGPEPEGVVVGSVRGRNYAFIGNERTSNIMIYDLTVPDAPQYVGMAWNRNLNAATNTAEAGDLGPEGLTFVREQDSPTGKALLIVANEVSGTVTVWQVE